MKERGNIALRRMDAFGGVPLLLFLRICKRSRPAPQNIRSIGILRTSCMGDTVLLSGIVADLRAALPSTTLRFFAGETNFDTAKTFMREEEVRRIKVTSPLSAVRLIRREKLDVLLDFGPWPRVDALIATLSGARYTAGFRTARQFRHYCYDLVLEHSREIHELANYRRVIKAINVPTTHEPCVLIKGGPVIDSTSYVVFHPWPGGYQSHLREWPAESWQELARLIATSGFSIVLSGLESDRPRSQALVERMSSAVQAQNLAGRFDLADTCRLLRHAAAVVSVNTGIMHLAAAIGTPTVGLSGPTSVARWGAIGNNVRNVAAKGAGCGYLDLGFEYRGQRLDCMEQISVADAWDGVQQVMAAAAH